VTRPIPAARLYGPGDIRIETVPPDAIAPGSVRLRVTAVGLCGSDRHWFVDGAIGRTSIVEPLVPGHEFIGVVLDGPRAGERVAADPAIPCGRCATCSRGAGHLCPLGRFAGYPGTPGALRAEMAWPADLLHPIPDRLLDDDAVLAEPLGIALHAVELADVRPGDRVGVFGCGPIGLLLVRLLDHLGARVVIATDVLEHRLDVARSMGADETRLVTATGGDAERAGPNLDLDVAFEVAGEDAAVDDAIHAVRPGGRVILVGIPGDERTSFVAEGARRKELAIRLCRRMRATDLPRAIALLANELVPTLLVSGRFELTRAAEAFATLATRDGVKVVIQPSVAAG
jgi:L-iditol 2-dehydrogenase